MFVLLGDRVARQNISVYLICLSAKMSGHSTSLLGSGLSDLFKVTGLVTDLGLDPRPPNSQLRKYSTTHNPLCLLYSHNERHEVTFLHLVPTYCGKDPGTTYLFNLPQSTQCRNQKRLFTLGVPCILSCILQPKCQGFRHLPYACFLATSYQGLRNIKDKQAVR